MAFAAAIPMWLTVAGAAVSAVAAYQQGQAAKAAGEYNALVSQQNAMLARQQAASQAKQQDRLNRLRLGSIRAQQGKSGGAANEGSVLDIIGDTVIQGEMQRQEILRQGEIEARSHLNQSTLSRMGASAAGKAGTIKAGSALLGGATNTAAMIKRG